MFGELYRGKKVLVTGHTGFKGSWLVCWLTRLGADVVGYSLPAPTVPSNYEACGLEGRITSITGDVRDHERLAEVIREQQPEMLFHLAAQPLVRLSYQQPRETYETNVMGVVNLFEAVRCTPSVRVLVNVTSDKCYHNREWVWGYRENDPMGGRDPYSSSKGCSELITAAYTRSFFPPEAFRQHGVTVASVRAGNVIGGGDWAEDRLVPDCIRSLVKGEPVLIRNPGAIRPWQHVLEPLGGYLWLGARMMDEGPRFSGGWNFGPRLEDTLTVGEVAERLVTAWGEGTVSSSSPDSEEPYESGFLRLDCSKAFQLLDWQPAWSLEETLDRTAAWYRTFMGNGEMFAANLAEIEEYARSAADKGIPWALD